MMFIKKFLIIISFNLFFTFSSYGDDIKDFQIEGISIGDNLLDYISKKELKEALEIFNYKNNEYRYYFLKYPKSKDYEFLQITIKPKDKNFQIHGIQGHIFYTENIDECYKKIDEIKKDIDKVLDVKATKDQSTHSMDKTGKSKYTRFSYYLSNGSAEIICYDMSKDYEKDGKYDRFAITLGTSEFLRWLTEVHYK